MRLRTFLLGGSSRSPVARNRRSTRHKPHRIESLEVRMMLHGDAEPDPTNTHTDPAAAAEHAAVMELVPLADVTHRAVKNGEWDNPATWDRGIPTANANVLIPANVDVVLDSIQREELRTVRVDGELEFAPNVNTHLAVDTLVVSKTGALEIGTEERPIAANVTARLVIADRGAIDTDWDPTHVSRGLISHGHVSMFGAQVTAFVPIANSLTSGTTTIVLPQVPAGWKVGDRLVLSGSQYGQHDELQIKGIQGSTLTVNPLTFSHRLPESGLSLHLANVTRNIVVESENAKEISRRGHAMFMHSADVDINNAGFYGLGRTDKRFNLNSGKLDASGELIAGTGLNQVGRYSVHFHRTGIEPGGKAAEIRGSVVVDSPGWGIVNHHSNVVAEDNAAFDVFGAAFVSEAGDEIGAFRRNLAIYSEGSGEFTDARGKDTEPEFGHEGVGFWVQGSGVDLIGNIASGQRHGFILYGQGLKEGGRSTQFPAYNLPNPAWSGGFSAVAAGSFPIQFKDNVAYASNNGLSTFYHRELSRTTEKTQIDRFTAWNVGNGVAATYTFQVDFNDLKLLGNGYRGTGILRHEVSRDFAINGGRIEGFGTGVMLPFRGQNVINGTYLNNVTDVHADTGYFFEAENRLQNVRFGRINSYTAARQVQRDVYVAPLPTYQPRELGNLFVRNVAPIYLNGKELYRPEQAASYVLFKAGTPPNQAPPEFIGKTNQQLLDQYGLALGGAVAPPDAVPLPSSNAIIGTPSAKRNVVEQVSGKLVTSLDYKLSYRVTPGGPIINESSAVNLRSGWNVLTRQIDGAKYGFLVYADVTPPKFTLSAGTQLAIHPEDLAKGIVIRGTTVDDFYNGAFETRFRLDTLAVQTRSDGTRYVTVKFDIKDFAGNTTPVSLDVRLDASVPRIKDVPPPGSVVLDPFRKLSLTVLGQLITPQI